MEGPDHSAQAMRQKKTFVLCFDGTGNKFSGTPSDSNILKIFRMLDASDPSYHIYYQPGIGTYVQSATYSHTSVFTKTYSWLQKTRDSMIGSSFDQHLMAGYKFLMRYYQHGDDICIFGFSRGSYTARFLAEMLDMVGLLPAGNEEMARFAFKAFARWQRRLDGTEEEKKQKREMFEFMQAFRETFSRPVRRIRFLGLFDTVNSVPRFEGRFMKRPSKFPYTAKSSALVIRHAVAIDERRAKFRQDLIGETRPTKSNHHVTVDRHPLPGVHDHTAVEKHDTSAPQTQRFQKRHGSVAAQGQQNRNRSRSRGRPDETKPKNPQSVDNVAELRKASIGPLDKLKQDGASFLTDTASITSMPPVRPHLNLEDDEEDDEELPQDIQEIWFPGGHADIGGGWPMDEDEEFPLSHAPLVWMVREAQRAGLRFVHDIMVRLRVVDQTGNFTDARDFNYEPDTNRDDLPALSVPDPTPPQHSTRSRMDPPNKGNYSVDQTITLSAEKGKMHDCLRYGMGTPAAGVIGWKVMEWMPFARMDLQPDNSWRAIRWPLPRGEVRDIPDSAVIHTSALKRMKADPKYRPGNLIVGGGGRGIVIAPKKYGIGEWEMCREEGIAIGECMVRKSRGGQQNEPHQQGNANGKVNGNTNEDTNGSANVLSEK